MHCLLIKMIFSSSVKAHHKKISQFFRKTKKIIINPFFIPDSNLENGNSPLVLKSVIVKISFNIMLNLSADNYCRHQDV